MLRARKNDVTQRWFKRDGVRVETLSVKTFLELLGQRYSAGGRVQSMLKAINEVPPGLLSCVLRSSYSWERLPGNTCHSDARPQR